MVNEAHQLPQIGAVAQVDYAIERRMVVEALADLDELDAAAEVVDNILIALWIPPFRSKIVFPA